MKTYCRGKIMFLYLYLLYFLLNLKCLEVLRAKENVVAEELISEITPKGKGK